MRDVRRDDVMLSTIDNPHSPFTDFRSWYQFDEAKGYHTTSLLGRLVQTSEELSDADYDLEIENVIDEIVAENITGMFIKVYKEVD